MAIVVFAYVTISPPSLAAAKNGEQAPAKHEQEVGVGVQAQVLY